MIFNGSDCRLMTAPVSDFGFLNILSIATQTGHVTIDIVNEQIIVPFAVMTGIISSIGIVANSSVILIETMNDLSHIYSIDT